MIRLTCIVFGHSWNGDICVACGVDKWVLNTGHPRPGSPPTVGPKGGAGNSGASRR